MTKREQVLQKIIRLKNILMDVSTGTSYNDNDLQNEYLNLRNHLIQDSHIKSTLPEFVLTCRQLEEFWGFLKKECDGSYAERRLYLAKNFNPVLSAVESGEFSCPSDENIADSLKSLNSESVNEIWQKTIKRRYEDPSGALTSSRTLLETVIKHILEDINKPYDENEKLPALYKKMAVKLELAPNSQTEPIFKQLLSGCHNVVEGIGAIRNNLSDSHGKGRASINLEEHHVELGVNMAGALATFWVKVFLSKKL